MTDDIEKGSTFTPAFDRDGLMPAMAIEKSTGTPLMLAYVNQTAVDQSLETGYAHFWSRSRKALWQKGETSGNRLKLLEILTDCDQDCLCFLVELEGKKAACHTGRKSCFYRRLTGSGKAGEPGTLAFKDDELHFDPGDVYGKKD